MTVLSIVLGAAGSIAVARAAWVQVARGDETAAAGTLTIRVIDLGIRLYYFRNRFPPNLPDVKLPPDLLAQAMPLRIALQRLQRPIYWRRHHRCMPR